MQSYGDTRARQVNAGTEGKSVVFRSVHLSASAGAGPVRHNVERLAGQRGIEVQFDRSLRKNGPAANREFFDCGGGDA